MKPSPSDAFLVFCGGGVGAIIRVALTALFPDSAVDPLTTDPLNMLPVTMLAINCAGALILGVLTGFLNSRSGGPWVRSARLTLGTGVLGGFTSYSSFALALAQLGAAGQYIDALIYLVLSLFGGYLMAWSGLRWGKVLGGREHKENYFQKGRGPR
ncbi:fluoride efflux transporter FluC [Rothia sp. CCM 9417]|uniref:fluoride efflux transporter FluC n=1 Tax=Rothia sp. CCM 9417 TaxID=3402657 RepID=UPI003ADA8BEF